MEGGGTSSLQKPLSCERELENYLRKHDREACAVGWPVKVKRKTMHSQNYQGQVGDARYRGEFIAQFFLK